MFQLPYQSFYVSRVQIFAETVWRLKTKGKSDSREVSWNEISEINGDESLSVWLMAGFLRNKPTKLHEAVSKYTLFTGLMWLHFENKLAL